MTKKFLLRRIEALEVCLGRLIQREEIIVKRIQDLEEIVFDCNICDSTPVNQPDRTSN